MQKDDKTAACLKSFLYPDAWFPTGNKQTEETKAAILICNGCPIKRECARMVIDSLDTTYPIKTGIYAGIRLANTHSGDQGGAAGLRARYDALRKIAEMDTLA